MAERGVTEEVAEVIEVVGEEVIDVAEVVRNLTAMKLRYLALGAAAGAATGALIAWKMAWKRADKDIQEEIKGMREHYQQKEAALAARDKPDLQTMAEDLGYSSNPRETQYEDLLEVKNTPPVPITESRNIFKETVETTKQDYRGLSTDVWNYEREMQSRSEDVPYVIHKEEFAQGNFGGEDHEQVTLTYFIQDDVLCNERDEQIPEMDEMIGLANLGKFGHGSEDANVVYVRNHQLKVDFEILRDGGSFAATVHGVPQEDDLQHSAMRRRRRGFDDA